MERPKVGVLVSVQILFWVLLHFQKAKLGSVQFSKVILFSFFTKREEFFLLLFLEGLIMVPG